LLRLAILRDLGSHHHVALVAREGAELGTDDVVGRAHHLLLLGEGAAWASTTGGLFDVELTRGLS
jgi:hypothetical protein